MVNGVVSALFHLHGPHYHLNLWMVYHSEYLKPSFWNTNTEFRCPKRKHKGRQSYRYFFLGNFFRPAKKMEYQIRYKDNHYESYVQGTSQGTPKPLPGPLQQMLEWLTKTDFSYQAFHDPIPGLIGDLMNHQKDALGFILKRHRSILAMEMGLGKTITIIAKILVHLISNPGFRTLIIVPSGDMANNWQSELKKFAPGLTSHHVKKSKDANFTSNANITFMTLPLLNRCLANEGLKHFHLIVLDEAHMIKNIDSNQSKAMVELCKKICPDAGVVLLTGTPAMSHTHFYGLLRIIHPIFAHWFHFRPHGVKIDHNQNAPLHFADRYCGPIQIHIGRGRKVWQFKANTRPEELQAITRPFFFRLLKTEVLDLPELIVEQVVIGELNTKQRKDFQEKLGSVAQVKEKSGLNAGNAIISELVRETMRLKTPYVCSYIENVLETVDSKFICFVHHHEIAKALCDMLDKNKVGYIHIDGDTKMDDRSRRRDQLEHDENIRVGVLSYVCAVGLNFTFIPLCFFCERTFEAVKQTQAESRIHRIGAGGEKGSVMIQYLDLKYSMDEQLKSNVKRKLNTEAFLLRDQKEDKKHRSSAVSK